jgi:hypothetical protein
VTKQARKRKQRSNLLTGTLAAFNQEQAPPPGVETSPAISPAETQPEPELVPPLEPTPAPPPETELWPATAYENQPPKSRLVIQASATPARLQPPHLPGIFKGWRFIKSILNRQSLAQQFLKWVADDSLTKQQPLYDNLAETTLAFSAWLTTLSTGERVELRRQLTNFCAIINFDLDWFLSPWLDGSPALKQTLETIVTLYCLAHWKGTRVNQILNEIETSRTLQRWKSDLSSKKHRDLSQRLFAKLVEMEVVKPPSTEIFLASTKARQSYVAQEIRQVAIKNRQVLSAILKEI